MGNTHLFLDIEVVSRWSVRLRSLRKSQISICQKTKTYFLVTFTYATEGGESGAPQALFHVKHIANNEFCDLAGLGSIFYLDLTY